MGDEKETEEKKREMRKKEKISWFLQINNGEKNTLTIFSTVTKSVASNSTEARIAKSTS